MFTVEKETDFLGTCFELELGSWHLAREKMSSSCESDCCSSSRDSTSGGKLSQPTRSTSPSGNESKGMFMLGIRNIGVERYLLEDGEKDTDEEADVCNDGDDACGVMILF